MICRRAFEIDLGGFLEDPRADAFADFRDHYPRCPDCSAEVGAWTELEVELRARNDARHPGPEQLARFPEGLDARERIGVERHLVECAACRDELRALEAFVPESLPGAGTQRRAKGGGRLRHGWAALGRLAWSPGFAYAALAAVLLPTIYRTVDSLPPKSPQATSVPQSAPESEMDTLVRVKKDDVRRRESVAREVVAPASRPDRAVPKLESALERQEPAPVVLDRKRAIESPALKVMEAPRFAADRELDEAEAPAARVGMAHREPPSSARSDKPIAAYAPPAPPEKSVADAPGASRSGAESARGQVSGVGEADDDWSDGRRTGSREFSAQSLLQAMRLGSRDRLAERAPVRLAEGTPAEIDPAIAAHGFRLMAPLPHGLAPGEIEIRVTDATGRRELRERARIAFGQTQVELEIPARWMGAGIYRVTIHDSRASGDDAPLAAYVFWLVDRAP